MFIWCGRKLQSEGGDAEQCATKRTAVTVYAYLKCYFPQGPSITARAKHPRPFDFDEARSRPSKTESKASLEHRIVGCKLPLTVYIAPNQPPSSHNMAEPTPAGDAGVSLGKGAWDCDNNCEIPAEKEVGAST